MWRKKKKLPNKVKVEKYLVTFYCDNCKHSSDHYFDKGRPAFASNRKCSHCGLYDLKK